MKSIFWLLGAVMALHAPSAYAQVESNFSNGGGVKIGWSNTLCDGAIEGSLRYNSTAGGSVDFCHGGTWRNVSSGGASAASPDRGIQFNSGGAFTAESTFVYTSAGLFGLGVASPVYTITLSGSDADRSIGLTNETAASTAGRNLNIYAGGALSGTNINGGNLTLSSGRATGHGYSSIDFLTVMPRQGNGATLRNPVSSLTLASNALTIPRGTTAQRPGQAGYQAAANGMIRYNTDNNKFEAYQASGWVDMIGGGAASPTRAIQFNNAGAFAGDANFVYTAANRVGLGTGSPQAKLDVQGAIQIGDNSETCAAASDHGNVRYNGITFQFCNDYNTGWENMAIGATVVTDEFCDASKTFSSPGTSAYKVPDSFGTLTIRLWGAGGGGGAVSSIFSGTPATAGGATSITSLGLIAYGGSPGGSVGGNAAGAGGAGGSASGGTINTTGVSGSAGSTSGAGGNGGASPNGGAGGLGQPGSGGPGGDGNTPGAGGGGAGYNAWMNGGGGGGGGGFLEKTYTPAQIPPGTIISDLAIGSRGTRGTDSYNGGHGAHGRITIICSSGGNPTAAGGDDQIAYFSGGSLTSNSTFVYSPAGFVGIGTTTPSATLHVEGDIAYTGVTTDISDQRRKDNIAPLSPALAQIMAMTPVSFTMKADANHVIEYGFIAQDIEKIYPVLVKTADDVDHTKSMNYIGLIAPMVKAIQEEKALIDEQRAIIIDLQKRVEALGKSLKAQNAGEE